MLIVALFAVLCCVDVLAVSDDDSDSGFDFIATLIQSPAEEYDYAIMAFVNPSSVNIGGLRYIRADTGATVNLIIGKSGNLILYADGDLIHIRAFPLLFNSPSAELYFVDSSGEEIPGISLPVDLHAEIGTSFIVTLPYDYWFPPADDVVSAVLVQPAGDVNDYPVFLLSYPSTMVPGYFRYVRSDTGGTVQLPTGTNSNVKLFGNRQILYIRAFYLLFNSADVKLYFNDSITGEEILDFYLLLDFHQDVGVSFSEVVPDSYIPSANLFGGGTSIKSILSVFWDGIWKLMVKTDYPGVGISIAGVCVGALLARLSITFFGTISGFGGVSRDYGAVEDYRRRHKGSGGKDLMEL